MGLIGHRHWVVGMLMGIGLMLMSNRLIGYGLTGKCVKGLAWAKERKKKYKCGLGLGLKGLD